MIDLGFKSHELTHASYHMNVDKEKKRGEEERKSKPGGIIY